MKRYFQLSLVILAPYMILFALVCIWTGFLMKSVFQNNGYLLIAVLAAFYLFAFISSLVTLLTGLIHKWSAREFLKANMIIKLVHIPAYVLIFIIGLLAMITIFTMAISFLLMLFDFLTIVISGMIGLGGVIRAYQDKSLSRGMAVLYGILQFIYVADVAIAVIAYLQAGKRTPEVR